MAKKLPFSPAAVGSALTGLAVVGGLGFLGMNSVYSVSPGQAAVMFNRISGVQDRVIGEGTKVMIPWFDKPHIFDIRTRPREFKSTSGSRDLQMVTISLRVLTRPRVDSLPVILRDIGEDFDEKVLPSIVHEVLKQVIAQFTAPQLLTQREQVSLRIKRNLTERAEEFHIVLEDVSITDLQFGREFMHAVEQKQVAQQDAERARFMVEKAMQDRRSVIIRAQGDAKAAALVGEALKENDGYIQLRRIDAAREISAVIARSANTVYLPSDSLLLDLSEVEGDLMPPDM